MIVKWIEVPPNALFNSLVTVTPVILYDTIKFVKILA